MDIDPRDAFDFDFSDEPQPIRAELGDSYSYATALAGEGIPAPSPVSSVLALRRAARRARKEYGSRPQTEGGAGIHWYEFLWVNGQRVRVPEVGLISWCDLMRGEWESDLLIPIEAE